MFCSSSSLCLSSTLLITGSLHLKAVLYIVLILFWTQRMWMNILSAHFCCMHCSTMQWIFTRIHTKQRGSASVSLVWFGGIWKHYYLSGTGWSKGELNTEHSIKPTKPVETWQHWSVSTQDWHREANPGLLITCCCLVCGNCPQWTPGSMIMRMPGEDSPFPFSLFQHLPGLTRGISSLSVGCEARP